jgi:integrase
MGQRLKMTIRRSQNGSFYFDVYGRYTPTGKATRKTFKTRREAEAARSEILNRVRDEGMEAATLPSMIARDAQEALGLLRDAGLGVSLAATAKAFVEAHRAKQASVTFSKCWQVHEESLSAKSAAHRRTVRGMGKKLLPHLGEMLVCDISHAVLRDVLSKEYPTAHGFNLALRTISPAFNRAVKEGWIDENPCTRIEKRDTGRHEIEILTLAECRKLMISCKDFRRDESKPSFNRKDAREAVAAVALMLFAGVRPGEVARLTWDNIDLDTGTIRVSNKKAKTDRSRVFNMPDTLREWLELTPPHKRTGIITPPSWEKVWQVIRREAGIADKQDALRHSFASYHLAHRNDINLTRSIMGHETAETIFTNYRAVVTPREAAEFWKILPGSDLCLEIVSA